MKSLLGATIAMALLVGIGVNAYFAGQRAYTITVSSLGPTIEEVRSLADLVTTSISVSDILVAESEGYKGSWLIKGDVVLGINLEHVEITDKDDEGRTATIILPPPHVVLARVDHDRTLTWDVKRVTWNLLKWDQSPLRDQAMKEAQDLVESVANSESESSSARRQAELIIEKLYRMVGWKVQIQWRKPDQPEN